jgi:hypothetical protein
MTRPSLLSNHASITVPKVEIENVSPMMVSIAEARRISGMSRSELYRRLAANKFMAVKSGSRTLIVLDSLIVHLKSLPAATFRAPR